MIALVQRVAEANVSVAGDTVGAIGAGILALIGVERGDSEAEALRLAERVLGYRIFPDAAGKMNLSLEDVRGELLAVPQFTLAADTNSGDAAELFQRRGPGEGRAPVRVLRGKREEWLPRVATGRFGADMQVSLVNDGPVTFWLQVSPKQKS